MPDQARLRELASWYREFAERAGSPVIWEGRLRMADDLDKEAARIVRELSAKQAAHLTIEDRPPSRTGASCVDC
jgi:hypothetical protein